MGSLPPPGIALCLPFWVVFNAISQSWVCHPSPTRGTPCAVPCCPPYHLGVWGKSIFYTINTKYLQRMGGNRRVDRKQRTLRFFFQTKCFSRRMQNVGTSWKYGCVNCSCAQFVVMESVFYFDQINNAGIFNVRIATSDLLHPPKCHPVFSPSQDPGDHLSPPQELPTQRQN